MMEYLIAFMIPKDWIQSFLLMYGLKMERKFNYELN